MKEYDFECEDLVQFILEGHTGVTKEQADKGCGGKRL